MELLATSSGTNTNAYQAIFDQQVELYVDELPSTLNQRLATLKKLQNAVGNTYKNKIRAAELADLRKSHAETDLTEIYSVTSEAKHVRGKLHLWMAKQYVDTPLALIGSTSWVHYEPKGVCLIISPWNYPINLTFCPLISAIAAGNRVIVKPSEMTPHCAAVISEIIAEVFDPSEVACVVGGVEASTALLELPFHHIFFTGSPSIGKVVMTAAAKNLTSVTLELGGKSPVIVDESADINNAAKRIIWGKGLNNGQVCIAPDYLYIHESKKEEFVASALKWIEVYFSKNPKSSNDLVRIVNDKHYQRLESYLTDALKRGAKPLTKVENDASEKYIALTLLDNVAQESEVMKNEIFGPLLPIFTYDNIDEAIQKINANEKPLALYIYSKNSKNIDYIIQRTSAGGTCINNNTIQFIQENLPFGGVNNSGIGKGHGKYGFDAFSNARAVYKQNLSGALDLLMPPYTGFKQKIIDLVIRFF